MLALHPWLVIGGIFVGSAMSEDSLGASCSRLSGGWQPDEALESKLPTGCNVRTVGGTITAQAFAAIAHEPVLIANVSREDFDRLQNVWRKETFLQRFGNHTAEIYPRHMFETQPLSFQYPSFEKFLRIQMNGTELPSAQKWQVLNFQQPGTELALRLQRIFTFPDILPHVSLAERFPWSVSLGPSGAGLNMHSTHPAAWVAMVYGKKLWYLAAPGVLESNSTVYWGFGPKTLLSGAWDHMPRSTTTCVQEPRTILYIPHYWWHGTVNLGETISVNVEVDQELAEQDYGREALKSTFWRRSRIMEKVKSHMTSPGELSEKKRKNLVAAVLSEMRRDPLQVLAQSTSHTMHMWKFMVQMSRVGKFAETVTPIVAWLATRLHRRQLSSERVITQLVYAFPWGIDLQVERVATLAKEMSKLGYDAAFDGADWSSHWGENGLGTYTLKADAAPYVAAMLAQAGAEELAQKVMERAWDLGFVKTHAAMAQFFAPKLQEIIAHLSNKRRYKNVAKQHEAEVQKTLKRFR